MPDDGLLATAGYWDAYVERHMVDGVNTNRAEWLAHPTVQDYHRSARGGRSIESWVADVALDGRKAERGVGIGAGTGSLELGLVAADVAEHFDLLDVSAGALEQAARTASDLGVSDRVTTVTGDAHEFELGSARYDLATCMGSLHHVGELDRLLGATAGALAPDGVLVAYEYVGPDRFAAGPVESELARRFYRSLSPTLRSVSPELPLPDPDAVIAADPTEAIHSSEILASLARHFDRVSVVHHGGALAYTLWWGLDHDALFETREGVEFVDLLLRTDRALTSDGTIDDYFVTILASSPHRSPGDPS